ncbi:MAG: SDR family oxidoreductase [Chryseolinea sp.]
MNHRRKYAFVTGGTSGIGYELAKLLAADGYKIILVARDETELITASTEIKENYGVEVITISKDLFYPENALELYSDIAVRNIEIEILINNAGQGQYGEFVDTDIIRELDIINLNISSLVVLTKLALQDMVSRGSGRIMNLSSVASKTPGPWQSVYHGTKAFVQSFTEAVRSEVKDSGVTVTALLPGATATDFFRKADMEDAKNIKECKLDDAADVAREGYRALMEGEDMVVSGFKNKMQVAMAAITPDAKLANKTKEKQAPASDNDSEKDIHLH